MIEKLKPEINELFGMECPIYNSQALLDTVNQLVDAVNEQQLRLDNFKCWLVALEHKEKPAEEPADSYAEQRKWIGKLCKFWDDDPNDYVFDKLKEITFAGCYIKESGFLYEHCEPVKPDDDVIYKGGDNE